jgi:cyclophilin family peptidyl-prolyl cis-trans isomerase
MAAQRRRRTRNRAVRTGILALLGLGLAFLVYNNTKPEGTEVSTDPNETTSTTEFVADPTCPPEEGTAERTVQFAAAPPRCIDTGKDYSATVETDLGTVTIDLFEDKAPQTVNNFVFLARNKYYDDVPFHRVIPGFVVQGGDGEKGDGTGGPGYNIPDELPEAGEYEIGSLAMANASQPNTGGSQFFIITGDQGAGLPPQYSLFGNVTDGLDIVKQIEADGSDGGTPQTVHKILKVTISSK